MNLLLCMLIEDHLQQIDVGEESGPRTVVSGLVNYIPIENMRGKYLVAVVSYRTYSFRWSKSTYWCSRSKCNLKPATMRGVKSFAMVLCVSWHRFSMTCLRPKYIWAGDIEGWQGRGN